MSKKNRNKNRHHGKARGGGAPFVNQLRHALSPAQRQTVTVPCRQVVPIQWGQTSQDITFARVAEQGLVSNVFGYNGSSQYTDRKKGWEFFYVDRMELEWCPSNLVGTFGSTTANFTQQSLGPFILTDVPDLYSQNGDSLDARLQRPTFTMKPVLTPWKVVRNNAKLYGAGCLAQGNCQSANPMYGQIATNTLAAASLGLQVPGTGSTQLGSKYFAGVMIVTYHVRFVSIKPFNQNGLDEKVIHNPPIPCSMPPPPRPLALAGVTGQSDATQSTRSTVVGQEPQSDAEAFRVWKEQQSNV